MKSAECVTPNHPDKLCDRISDAVLDACLEQDAMSRVAIETMGGHGIITITGELTTNANINVVEIAKRIAGEKYSVQVNIANQSPEIARGVDMDGAGDQGIMVGYACNDNELMIPRELYLARSLCKFIYGEYPYDGKTEIVLDYEDNISHIVASFQNVSSSKLKEKVNQWLTQFIVPDRCEIICNSAGDWNLGGFDADTGLTGRKLIVDNYGPQIPIGGGAFSGKDATKVDRSGAYMARRIAVDYMRVNPDKKDAIVKLAYVIGKSEPIMATVELRGEAGDMSGNDRSIFVDINHDSEYYGVVFPPVKYDLTPKGIIETLKLREPQFEETARWGHFGGGFTWDK